MDALRLSTLQLLPSALHRKPTTRHTRSASSRSSAIKLSLPPLQESRTGLATGSSGGARCALAVAFGEEFLAQANELGRDLDQLVFLDELQRLFQ